MKRVPWLAALALFAILPASQAEWIWNRLYFQMQSAVGIACAFAFYAPVIGLAAWLLTLCCGTRLARALLHAAIVIMLFEAAFNGLREAGTIPPAAPLWLKIVLVVAASGAAWFAAMKWQQETWSRLYPALLVASPIFTLSPWLIAMQSAPEANWPSPSRWAATAPAVPLPRQNTIVVLLDEFSDSAAAPVIDALKGVGLQLEVSSIEPAGNDTINVIPAIWMRENFDRAAPCGPTELCSGGNAIDFSRVKASSPDIDVVAFYHPYCAMQGLRSCRLFPFPHKPALSDLTCELLKKPRFLPLDCQPSEEERTHFVAQRAGLQQALMEAPFWDKGGVLYAHLLQPHPLMGVAQAGLKEEYAAGIADSARLIAAIAVTAQARFGKDFRLVVFSDHPLRPQVWCGQGFYRAEDCKPAPDQLSKQVPLIVASQDSRTMPAITSNRQVFDLLFQN